MSGLHRFLSNWQNILGLAIVTFYFFVAIAAPLLSPVQNSNYSTTFQSVGLTIDLVPHPPFRQAPLGTLPGQIDIFHALVWGTRSALAFGLTVALVAAIFGVLVGAISAYFGGWFNNLVMRITDAFLAVPIIAGVFFFRQLLVFISQSGGDGVNLGENQALYRLSHQSIPLPTTVDPMLVAFIVFTWMAYARIVNTLVLNTKKTDFVHASRAMGASHARIILRHLIPNSITPAVVLVARDIGAVVLLQATFRFIGMGGTSAWGEMLVLGRNWIIAPGGNLFAFWWIFIPATLALLLFGIGWNLLGDGLNDWLNPRTPMNFDL
jgi:peptide/nickel transport system permease protein